MTAIELIRALVEHGQWFISAIELDHNVDGELLRDEAEAILKAEAEAEQTSHS
jgi:hypothetical protein